MIYQDVKVKKCLSVEEPIGIKEKLKILVATKLQDYWEHTAASRSKYINIGDFKIRIANHENTSKKYAQPNLNVVKRKLNKEDYNFIESKITYPEWVKQKVFADFVGLTIPKVKKLIPDECFTMVVLDYCYPNTFTKVVLVEPALKMLEEIGHKDKFPTRYEYYTFEDYNGFYRF